MSATIPEGLSELLEDFAVAVLREKPADLLPFAAHYFTSLLEQRGGLLAAKQQQDTNWTPKIITTDEEKDVEMMNEGSDEEAEAPSEDYRRNQAYRRQSVFAEAYNPSKEEDIQKIVHPKSDEQRRRLVVAVKKIFLFNALDQEQLNEVLDAMFEKKVNIGEVIIEQGDDGDNFYVIDQGTYDCLISKFGQEKQVVFQYNSEGFFGELALMYNTPRAATVQATSAGILWGLDRRTFKRIVCEAASRKREMYQAFLESVPMLKTLEPYELMNLADALGRRYYNDGECILREGDSAAEFFIVEEGEVEITKIDANGTSTTLKSYGRGEYFGELALLTHKPRAASAHAKGGAICAVLEVGAFERLLGPCKEIMKRNFQNYEEQLMKLFGTTLDISDT